MFCIEVLHEEFAYATNEVMKHAAEVARVPIGAHQSGIAIIVNKDWNTGRRHAWLVALTGQAGTSDAG